MASILTNKQRLFLYYLIQTFIIALLALATIIINWKMIRDGLNGMTDLKWHITWLQHFSKQLGEGIWYPRWLAGTNYGYGSPTFVFYPPLVYYLGSLLKFCGLNIEHTTITLFSLALFLSGLNFYIFGRRRWGVIASFVGTLAYMTTPYLARDIFFRGGLSSIFIQAWIPLLWFCTEKAYIKSKWRIGLAFTWTIIAFTHTSSLLLCAIIWFPYNLFFLLNRSWKTVISVILSAGLGLGVASLYLLPAILEKSFVNINSMKEIYGGFRANLFWSSLPFPDYVIRIVRHMQYIFIHQSLVIIALAVITFIVCRQNIKTIKEISQWLIMGLILAFMMSFLSMPIWVFSPTLQMIQFPWRFLQIFSFVGATVCGITINEILKLKLRFKFLLSLVIIFVLLINFRYSYKLSRNLPTIHNPGRGIIPNLQYFKTVLNEPYTDKLIDVREYRPLLDNNPPSPPIPIIGQSRFSVINGQANIQLNQWKSYQRNFDITVQEVSIIRIRTYYYPAWHLYVNNVPHPINMSEDGTIIFNLQPGSYDVKLLYQWTSAFKIGVILSILSFLFLTLYWFKAAALSRLS